MTAEYDLVIIGNTLAAQIAATTAVEKSARVAWVLPGAPSNPYVYLFPHGLHQASLTPYNPDNALYPWQYAQTMIDHFAMRSSFTSSAAQGVDVIYGNGEFVKKPTLSFNTKRRTLVARKYLLAMGAQPASHQIEGLGEAGYLTLATLSKVVRRSVVPQRWAIVGDEAIGVELAKSLVRLGYQVTLMVSTTQILPAEDPDTVALIQAQLEAAGVVLLTQAVISAAGKKGGHKYLVVNNNIIDVDEIFVATPEEPLVESFNLKAAGVEHDRKGVLVDNKLRTSNSRILACGSVCGKVLGGYHGEHLAEYEAKIAVNNALTKRLAQVNYHQLPWVIFSEPQLARIGLTETDACIQFQRRITTLKASYQNNTKALISETDVGFIKIMVRRSGQIIGATIVGGDAAELMQIVALAIQHRLSIKDLSKFLGVELTHTHLVVTAARQWRSPAKWLQIIDPILQWWVELWRSIVAFFDRFRFRPQSPKKTTVSISSKS